VRRGSLPPSHLYRSAKLTRLRSDKLPHAPLTLVSGRMNFENCRRNVLGYRHLTAGLAKTLPGAKAAQNTMLTELLHLSNYLEEEIADMRHHS